MRTCTELEVNARLLERMARTLRLLANPDRLRILLSLSGDERNVGTLARQTKLSSSRASQHLALLRAHGVVRDRRVGRRVYYRLMRPALARWLRDSFDQGALEPTEGERH